ncbi:GNAT family N-acetyltransferase [Alteromonas sp. S167]|uniref:GNAT family N-acetyltransferase n=1 Tax=Alteromonas sp. S167 TaxID=3117402 RepID=UPI002FDF0DEC
MHITDSARLSYHYITESDADFLWELDQDELVMKYINGGKKSSKEDIQNIFIPRVQAFSNFAFGWGLWRVDKLDDGESIGWILVRPFGFFTQHPETDNIELGWRFKQSSWGKGYATEAALTVKEALYEIGVEKFSAIANPDNAASINIMKKLGMSFSHELEYKDKIFDETVVVYTN